MNRASIIETITLLFFMAVAHIAFSQEGPLHSFELHQYRVNDVIYAPGGNYIASASDDKMVKIWQANYGTVRHLLDMHKELVLTIDYSNNGKYLASGSYNGTIRLWKAKKGRLDNTFTKHDAPLETVAFSPSGNFIASAGQDGTIKIWNYKTGDEQHILTGHTGGVTALSFGAKGKYLASGSEDQRVKLWKLDGANHEVTGQLNFDFKVNALAYNANNKMLAIGGRSGAIRLWNSNTGKLQGFEKSHIDAITDLAFTDDGLFLASCSKDGSIKLWNHRAQKIKQKFDVYNGEITSIDFSPNEQNLAAGLTDNTVKIWELADLQSIEAQIQNRVTNIIEKWKQNGNYQKLKEWNNNPDSVLQRLTRKVVDKIGEEKFRQVKNAGEQEADISSNNYTLFKVTFPDFNPIYLKIPDHEAQSFYQNFNSLSYSNLDFGFDKQTGKLFIKNARVFNPNSEETYHYDYHKKPDNFQKAEVKSPSEMQAVGQDGAKVTTGSEGKDEGGKAGKTPPDEDAEDYHQYTKLDRNLPKFNNDHSGDVAIVIGNSNYESNGVPDVDYAVNDAKLVKRYLVEALGFEEQYVKLHTNVTRSKFRSVFGDEGSFRDGNVYDLVDYPVGNVFFFYSGHGATEASNDKTYLVPVEASATSIKTEGFDLSTIRENLKKVAKDHVIVMDACLSGRMIKDQTSMLSYTPPEKLSYNRRTEITATDGNQLATWYSAKGHGLFTWFFLKAIKNYEKTDTNNDRAVTAREIHSYITGSKGVDHFAGIFRDIDQNPQLYGNEKKVIFKYD